ncbi:Uncharacterized membrane protein YphA, DoxX/SURF4 family [Paenibacillus sp. cl141a]|uniref:DoxX family protein n=1 Tax=Paenibacillus sp. cl141a TaxID=1761877 RepID=UPI0008ACE6F7|nr:DoxX family protein [Paenibacillus sp. cl141a]SEK87571.1 Uncharacterized membrane protein YphA, DoxX/SURF4 family [Paenibacillus sp. cl141a]
MKKWLIVIGWIVVWGTALFYAQNGIQKLMGAGQMVEMFHELGYPAWSRIAVGLLEVVGAILLVIPRATSYAAAVLTLLMAGAVLSEWRVGQTFEALLAGQWLVIFILILLFRYRFVYKSNKKELDMP